MGLRTIAPSLVLVLVLAVAACDRASGGAAASADEVLCSELGANVDPLEIAYSDKPALDARIRTFVSAARGLNDVTVEIERLAVDACRRMRRDLGAPDAPANAGIDVQCEPLRALLAKLAKDGIEVRISIAPPRCEPDAGRKARCQAVAHGPDDALCEAQSAIYARCSLPSISFAGSRNVDEVVKLGATLEANLPTLLFAEMALAQRLADHAKAITLASTKVATEVKDAGPRGIACIGLATEVTTKAATRLQSFVSVSSALLTGLDPEIRTAEGTR